MATTRFIGDTILVRFQALTSSGTPASLTGAKLWSGLKTSYATTADPPLVTKKNAAAGGDDGQISVTDATNAYFVAVYTPTNTGSLVAGTTYYVDGHVELADGSRWTAGLVSFRAEYPVQRTPPA